MLRTLLLAGVLLVLALPAAASAEVSWLCAPSLAGDPCRGDLTTRVFEADGTSEVERPAVPDAPKVDCFYVYPTTSNQTTTNATKAADPEIRSIAQYQAQRFSQTCRVFAPLYRQVTALGVVLASQSRDASPYTVAYEDVREAFREYLRTENRGRGFVLVGHSQGSRILRALLRSEVDRVPDVRRRLVSAIIPGANVVVARGRSTGGDFENIPACQSGRQDGCVMSWHTFNETPPANARFGRTDTDPVGSALDLPRGDFDVLCTDPSALAGRAGKPLRTLVPSAPFAPGIIGALLLRLYGGPAPSADTPWLTPADRYTAACEEQNGASVLAIKPVGSARKLNPSPDATWGVHLVDLNLPLGDVLRVLDTQIATYARGVTRPVTVRIAARRAGPGSRALTATVRGTAESDVVVSLFRGNTFLVRRTLSLDEDGIGRSRFRIRRAGSYRVRVVDTAERVARSGVKRVSLR
ncbi:MAG: hypothetical protein JWO90_583 [Solirubrobacterales bacterium]|jgi:hypothetical protein|nr:hypothetical protein [Solirubrobacterales bacterium]